MACRAAVEKGIRGESVPRKGTNLYNGRPPLFPFGGSEAPHFPEITPGYCTHAPGYNLNKPYHLDSKRRPASAELFLHSLWLLRLPLVTVKCLHNIDLCAFVNAVTGADA
jgi:hypothetical protein